VRASTWLLSAFLLSGCDACDGCAEAKKRVMGELQTPDEHTAEKLVRERLPSERAAASKLCGAPVGGLDDVKLKLKKSIVPGFYDVEIEGKPLPAPIASATAAASSTPAQDLAAAALCVGVLHAFFDADVGEGGEVESFKLKSLEVTEVRTPGHEWKKPHESSDWD